ncbi:hypothetical protein FGD71_030380 [Streptomyces sporangiiformans]|uniref:Uncharacterized protein n=1 Tax=Streptomyces sporangiiformans TaxID=2315329 RepID=A0A505D7J6_9ACTN|nr:hypothetical protein FGD71_030380 [Streptomyces sporangiiformans]
MTCQTCKTGHVHNPLTPDQKKWLEERLGTSVPHNYFMCLGTRRDTTPCRNLRTYGHEKHFRIPLRMPDGID